MPATKKRNGKGKTTDQIYAEVTQRIVEALEEGTVPWKRPWRIEGGSHMNLIRKKPYRGVNIFLLDLTAALHGYTSPYWLTFNQAKDLGGNVKRGEKSTLVVFWKILKKKDEDDLDEKGKPKLKTRPLLRHYPVFNVEQCEGFEDKIPQIEEEEFDPIERAQQVIDGMPDAPKIKIGGDSADYNPFLDVIRVPRLSQFKDPEHHYSATFHEMVHSTGLESRLHRVKDWSSFGSEPYGKEELVAEMGAAMLAGFADIAVPTQDDSASYIASWLRTIKGDPKLVVQAASKAQRAADFILDVKVEEENA